MSLVEMRKYKETIRRTLLFLLPALVLLTFFFIWPIILTVYYSFTNLSLTGSAAQNTQFIALENYKKILTDPDVGPAVWKTLIFVIFSAVLGQTVFGFILAMVMKQKNVIFRRIVGAIIIACWVTPEIVAGMCLYSFFGDFGTFNYLLSLIGIGPIYWLFEWPMLSIILANIWRGVAFSMIVFQAAFDDIPKEVEEAATVDGATGFQSMVNITIPILKGTISTNMMLVTLQTLGVFGLIYTMTGGGPGNKTTTLPIYMYNQAFVNFQLGYGTAVSMILLLIGVVLSVFYVKSMKVEI
ncbi:MAG: carbohydrate ABC transporter permease [Lachnospirales bacterium]